MRMKRRFKCSRKRRNQSTPTSTCGSPWAARPASHRFCFTTILPEARQFLCALFEGFSGYLQTDGYASYAAVCKQEGITQLGCFDHARRKFTDAKKGEAKPGKKLQNNKVSKADVALGKIRKLYIIEDEIKSLTASEKQHQRQQRSKPLLDDQHGWLEKNVTRLIPGSLTHTAMNYALNQWPKLVVYCEDGHLNISNAAAENAIRPFTIGRKNWLCVSRRRSYVVSCKAA